MPAPGLPDDLIDAYRRFRTVRFPAERELYRRLAEQGQRPHTMVVACSDSRSGPEVVFDAQPGDLFVVRNVAALIPAYQPDGRSHAASAALEFAVLALGVRAIVVMGHAGCGGVAAAIDTAAPLTATDFIGTWVAGLRDLEATLDAADAADPIRRRRAVEHRSVEQSLANLRTFPFVRAREAAGAISIHGTWFDVATGGMEALGARAWVRVEVG